MYILFTYTVTRFCMSTVMSTVNSQQYVNSDGHAINSYRKIFSNIDLIREAREAFLILKGRTIDPNGLNIRGETS